MLRTPGLLTFLLLGTATASAPLTQVGPVPSGGTLVPTRQAVRAAGDSVEFGGRPVDLVVSPDGTAVILKDNRGLVVIDAASWRVRQELSFPRGGGSMHGIAVSRDGARVFATTAQDRLWEARIDGSGQLAWSRSIALPGPGGRGDSHACGIALPPDEKRVYVCLSRNNSLGVVDLEAGSLTREIPVGVAPFDVVVSRDGATAFVSNWGGRKPRPGEKTAPSAGTETLIDERGVASSGTVSFVSLADGREVRQVDTGLHPSDLALGPDETSLYVANANSDAVSVIDTKARRVRETVSVRPDSKLPFGSAPNGLAVSDDGRTLYVANGGNNAVAVVALAEPGRQTVAQTGKSAPPSESRILGFIPAGWYPGAVAVRGDRLYVANVKGVGSRRRPPGDRKGWHVYWYAGTANRVRLPDRSQLAAYTAQAREDAQVPQALRATERARTGVPARPVPERVGEPSVFEHVVYVIKENRTYDQVFGDLPQGNGDASLCLFGREVTPNHHALAEQFVLLDNFYCNGVKSADGHSWITEGNVTDHLEKAFGGFTRSYTFGDDPITYSSSGFLWDNALQRGLSFRNYGEMDYAEPQPTTATWSEIYRDFTEGAGKIRFKQQIGIENLRRFSASDYPGWNMRIPDVLRADRFLKELKEFEAKGGLPNLTILFLPQDHCSGTTPGFPTPRSHMADNDLALGRVVEGITRSRFWPKTCIFAIEDDPQDGFDHVDGHRSPCLVVSPYTRRGAVVSEFYNQTGVIHTMERILGLPPMNQLDAMAPVMSGCFTGRPDLRPYAALANRVPLDQMNPPVRALSGAARRWALRSMAQPLDVLDGIDEDTWNRALWFSVMGSAPYPAWAVNEEDD